MNNVTIIGRDDQERPTFKANIKQNPGGGWAVFTISSPVPLTDKQASHLPGLYTSMAKMAEHLTDSEQSNDPA